MAYVEVDVDLDEFDTEELVAEICSRMKREVGKKVLTDKQKKELKEDFSELAKKLNFEFDDLIEVRSLDDKIKYEHFAKVFKKYTPSELEKLLPE